MRELVRPFKQLSAQAVNVEFQGKQHDLQIQKFLDTHPADVILYCSIIYLQLMSSLYLEMIHELKNHTYCVFTNDLLYGTLCGIYHISNNYYSTEYDLGKKITN